jgi:hypothetical protein
VRLRRGRLGPPGLGGDALPARNSTHVELSGAFPFSPRTSGGEEASV